MGWIKGHRRVNIEAVSSNERHKKKDNELISWATIVCLLRQFPGSVVSGWTSYRQNGCCTEILPKLVDVRNAHEVVGGNASVRVRKKKKKPGSAIC